MSHRNLSFLFASLLLALPLTSNAGDVAASDSNLGRGNPGCGPGECPDGHGGCVKSDGPCCDDAAGPAAPGLPSAPGCPSTGVQNPINMMNGNKFEREVIFAGRGEMPLRFELFYNSKHYAKITPPARITGQWTYSYSAHLIINPGTIGQGGSVVELRRDDGQSLFFNEPASPAAGTVIFKSDEAGDYGYFRGLGFVASAYTGFEYKRLDGLIETYDASGQLAQIRSREGPSGLGPTHSISRDCVTTPGTCVVTVSRSLGGSMSFAYTDLAPGAEDSDSVCFRCPTTFNSPDSDLFSFSTNATTGVIETITFPLDTFAGDPSPPAAQAVKTFLYSGIIVGGCVPDWDCATALTGITDEAGRDWATWSYRRRLEIIADEQNELLEHYAWAFEGYHGSASELEDHVVFSQLDGATEGEPNWNDKFIATNRHGIREVFNIDHRDNDNTISTTHISPRLGSRRDIRTWDPSEPDPPNIEVVRVLYDYYVDTDGEKQGLLKHQIIDDGDDSSSTRRKTLYDYYADGVGEPDQLLRRKTELGGPSTSETTLRTTDYAWDLGLRKPTRTIVSRNGVDPSQSNPCAATGAECEFEEARTYTAEGRINTITVTDHTAISAPYATNGRTRVVDYDYTYFDAGKTRVQTVSIDGPRPGGSDTTTYQFTSTGFLQSVTDGESNTTTWSGHNGHGQPTSRQDPDGVTTTFVYNPRGWLRQMSRGGETWSYSYYGNGLIKQIDYPDGDFQAFDYTHARRLKSVENSFGDKITFDRVPEVNGSDRTGVIAINITVTKEVGGSDVIVATSTLREDSLGRLFEVSDPGGQTTAYTYELTTRLASIVRDGHAVHGDLTTVFWPALRK